MSPPALLPRKLVVTESTLKSLGHHVTTGNVRFHVRCPARGVAAHNAEEDTGLRLLVKRVHRGRGRGVL